MQHPIFLRPLRPLFEKSPYSSQRESQAIGHHYKFINNATRHTSDLGQVARGVQERLARSPASAPYFDYLHPFKVYPVPIGLLHLDYDPDKAWRTVRVRGGSVLTTSATGVIATGTDGVDQPYYGGLNILTDGSTPTSGCIDIVVPDSTGAFYFWLEIAADGLSAVMRWSTSLSATSYTDTEGSGAEASWTSTNAWTGAPTPDANHVMVAEVDTSTRRADHFAVIRQYQPSDVLQAGSQAAASIKDYYFLSITDQYITAAPNSDGTGTAVNIALPSDLWFVANSGESLDGLVVTYSSPDYTHQTRLASATISGTAYSETQQITPPFKNLVPIKAIDDPHTGVFVTGVELPLMLSSWDRRAWAWQNPQPPG